MPEYRLPKTQCTIPLYNRCLSARRPNMLSARRKLKWCCCYYRKKSRFPLPLPGWLLMMMNRRQKAAVRNIEVVRCFFRDYRFVRSRYIPAGLHQFCQCSLSFHHRSLCQKRRLFPLCPDHHGVGYRQSFPLCFRNDFFLLRKRLSLLRKLPLLQQA